MPVQTRASMERRKTDEYIESESRETHVLVSQDYEKQTEINARSPASITSTPTQGTCLCEGCILLKNEIEEIKRESKNLRSLIFPPKVIQLDQVVLCKLSSVWTVTIQV